MVFTLCLHIHSFYYAQHFAGMHAHPQQLPFTGTCVLHLWFYAFGCAYMHFSAILHFCLPYMPAFIIVPTWHAFTHTPGMPHTYLHALLRISACLTIGFALTFVFPMHTFCVLVRNIQQQNFGNLHHATSQACLPSIPAFYILLLAVCIPRNMVRGMAFIPHYCFPHCPHPLPYTYHDSPFLPPCLVQWVLFLPFGWTFMFRLVVFPVACAFSLACCTCFMLLPTAILTY